ncbi:MAG: sigma factor-like helix-turn-helix DNA-binding protein [Pelagibacteraceae bacterium]
MADFPIQYRERNWAIWRMRVIEKRTLDAIGTKFGVSRERVRQIVAKAERILDCQAWVKDQISKDGEMVMGALNVSTGIYNILTNMGARDMTLSEFVKIYTPADVMKQPNCGRQRLRQLIASIEEIKPDVSYIWTAGHGQNYNPAKHGGRCPGVGDAPTPHSLPGLYP